MQVGKSDIIIFLVITTAIILLLASFIISLIYLYQKKQISYQQRMDNLKLDHEKNLLSTQLEIQEDTFKYISREIHDNISLSLTLTKLHLNTFDWNNEEKGTSQLRASIEMLGRAINDLSHISKGLNADIINQQGMVKALENEVARIRLAGLFSIHFNITGDLVYMSNQKELIIFRIIQEAFNNIIKHSRASHASLTLHYTNTELHLAISDNGNGFEFIPNETLNLGKAGLKNMEARTKMIGGSMCVKSIPGSGTSLYFNIPI